MELYTGVDIVNVSRFKAKVQKFSEKIDCSHPFLKRLFNEEEIAHIVNRPNPYLGLAGRFAAKEAVIKAFSPIKKLSTYKDIIITGEKPEVKQPVFENIKLSVSISHDTDYAVASVTLLVD